MAGSNEKNAEVTTAAQRYMDHSMNVMGYSSAFHSGLMGKALDVGRAGLKKAGSPVAALRVVEDSNARADAGALWLRQMAYAWCVDNFITYLAELLALIFRTTPRFLKSHKGNRISKYYNALVEDLASYRGSTMEEFLAALAEDCVFELAGTSWGELTKYLENDISLRLSDLPGYNDLKRMVAIRNTIVHNRSIVNRRLISSAECFSDSLDEPVPVEDGLLLKDVGLLGILVEAIDRRATEQFQLPTIGMQAKRHWTAEADEVK